MPTFIAEKGTILNPNNGLTIQQIDALNKLAGVDTTYTSSTLSPAGQGMYRQSPNLSPPSAMSGFELQKEFWDARNAQRTNPVRNLTPSSTNTATPVAKPNVVQQVTNHAGSIANRVSNSYVAAANSPRVQNFLNTQNSPIAQAYNKISNSPNAQRIANGLNTAGAKLESGLGRATSGLVAVQAAVQVGTGLANFAKKPDIASAVNVGIDALSTGLQFVPNPIAKGLGILLAIGKPLITSFFGSPQNTPIEGVAASFSGGQSVGVTYVIEFRYDFPPGSGGTTQYSGMNAGGSGWSTAPYTDAQLRSETGIPGPITSVAIGSQFISGQWRVLVNGNQVASTPWFFGYQPTVAVTRILRKDGLPDTGGDPAPIVQPIPSPYGDGFQAPDLSGIESRLDDFQSRLGDLQGGLNNLQGLPDLLADIRGLQANNGVTPYVQPRIPEPLPMPKDKSKIVGDPVNKPTPTNNPVNINVVSKTPVTTPNKSLNPANQNTPVGKPAPASAPAKTSQQQKELDDRFKQCCEPSFSSVKVKKFDKCEDGAPKFVEITISVPKGTETATQKLFESVANTEGLQCKMGVTSVTFPDSWAGKVPDERPQAMVYYREWNGSKWGNYAHSVSIPHYSKPKGFKPSLPIIKKGSFFGILKFKDNSQIIVNCESITEAKRVINALKQFSGIQAKGARAKFGEYGDGDLKRVTTKAVRLDFYSKGRANALPDWSVDL